MGGNSKNFTYVPEETKAWFEQLGDLLTDSARLSKQGDHTHSVACFQILYDLVDALCRGDETVFADEYGAWMIPIDERKVISASERGRDSPEPATDAAQARPRLRSCFLADGVTSDEHSRPDRHKGTRKTVLGISLFYHDFQH